MESETSEASEIALGLVNFDFCHFHVLQKAFSYNTTRSPCKKSISLLSKAVVFWKFSFPSLLRIFERTSGSLMLENGRKGEDFEIKWLVSTYGAPSFTDEFNYQTFYGRHHFVFWNEKKCTENAEFIQEMHKKQENTEIFARPVTLKLLCAFKVYRTSFFFLKIAFRKKQRTKKNKKTFEKFKIQVQKLKSCFQILTSSSILTTKFSRTPRTKSTPIFHVLKLEKHWKNIIFRCSTGWRTIANYSEFEMRQNSEFLISRFCSPLFSFNSFSGHVML